MKIKNKIFQATAGCILLIAASLFVGVEKEYAQVPVMNNGTSIANSTVVKVNGHFYHQNNGNMVNSGNIHITGDWTNNNSANPVFTTGPDGWIRLVGDTQTIGGSTMTHFNNLELSGTGTKQLNNVNVEIEDTLALNDRNFSAGNNTVLVKNTNMGAVTRANTITGGFVSSANDGGLSRNTASTQTYSFPVGSSAGTIRYRPIDLTPNSSSANTFKVRMANVNPTNENYDASLKQDTLCGVNSDFYHRIYQTTGNSSADIRIYFDSAADGNYQTIAHWQGTPQRWENTNNNIFTSGSPLSYLTKTGWGDFATYPFALAKLSPVASITTNAVCRGNSAIFTAPVGFVNYKFFVNGISQGIASSNSFSPSNLKNGDVVGVLLYDIISCRSDTGFTNAVINANPVIITSADDTINLGDKTTLTATGAGTYFWQPGNQSGSSFTVSPKEETTYTVIGTDANGCSDTATVTVFIDATCVHWLPNIFSPNNDGKNDEFKVLGKGLGWINLSVYDRWGNRVFETNDVNGAWDGSFNGKTMNNAVFVYLLKGKCYNEKEEFKQHGNVTLTR